MLPLMTGAALTNLKGLISIMTGAARQTCLHVIHCCHRVSTTLRPEWTGMTFVTAEHINMNCMRKDSLTESLINDIAGMTACTVFLDIEGIAAIVAGPAGHTGLHLLHAHLITIGLGLKHLGMTFATTEHLGVNGMTESHRSDVLRLHGYVIGILVTADTVPLDSECGIAVMAGSTGLSTLHLFHTNRVAVGFSFKGRRVTFVTTEHPGVDLMTEDNLSH